MSSFDRDTYRHVDWDLLADHLGGALAGTAEQERVVRLVATDPAWARAAADLTTALAAVAADLHAVPAPAPMPADVAGRLDTALRQATGSPRQPSTAISTSPVGGRPPTRSRQGPGLRRRRRRAAVWGAGAAVAAGVVAFATLGLGLGAGPTFTGGDDSGEAGSAADAPIAPFSAGADALLVVASGTDYRPGSPLFTQRLLAPPPVAGMAQDGDARDVPEADEDLAAAPDGAVPDDLERVRVELELCLDAVLAAHEPAPAQVALVDFASFEQEPAVVIWVTTADDATWVWVAGADCGTPQAGPDQRYQARLG